MCIRDRGGGGRGGLAAQGHGLRGDVRHGGGLAAQAWQFLAPVSYTHLDVYKRQVPSDSLGRIDGARTRCACAPGSRL